MSEWVNPAVKKITPFTPFAWQKELISNHTYVPLINVIAFHSALHQREPWQWKWSWHTILSSIVLESAIHKVLSVICHSPVSPNKGWLFCCCWCWPELSPYSLEELNSRGEKCRRGKQEGDYRVIHGCQMMKFSISRMHRKILKQFDLGILSLDYIFYSRYSKISFTTGVMEVFLNCCNKNSDFFFHLVFLPTLPSTGSWLS